MFNLSRRSAACVGAALVGVLTAVACGADGETFSGPQIGETATPFKVVSVSGPSRGNERKIDPGKGSATTVLVFVHGIERSIVPLLTVVDQYGHEKRDSVATEFVFLADDRAAGEKRLPLVAQSLHVQCPMSMSPEGLEGPGNYGLNKACLMTIVVTKDRGVTANFALVQPGIADAPAVIQAIAKACGDNDPPTPEDLRARRAKAVGSDPGRGGRRMGEGPGRDSSKAGARPDLPGATPTDARLVTLLRAFIQKTNDDATVDRIVHEVEEYVKDKPDLTRQAVGGWTRVLHLKYGTEYAHKAGQEMVERLKKNP